MRYESFEKGCNAFKEKCVKNAFYSSAAVTCAFRANIFHIFDTFPRMFRRLSSESFNKLETPVVNEAAVSLSTAFGH